MAELNRAEFIELLNRLGAEDDQAALAAARALHRAVTESGVTWNDLLYPESDGPAAAPFQEAAAEPAEDPPEPEPEEEPVKAEEAEEAEPDPEQEAPAEPPLPVDRSEDGRILDRLLARKGLSKAMREEVRELKRAHAEGGLDAMDRRYIRALSKRLGA